MSYADTNEVPITVEIGGKEITVRPNTNRDYQSWLDELTQQMRESDRKALLSCAIKGQERFQLARQIELSEVIPPELEPKVFTNKGGPRIIKIALAKAGIDEKAADEFLDSRTYKENEMLAVRVSGLFTQDRIAAMYPPPELIQYALLARVLIEKGIVSEDDFKPPQPKAAEKPDPNPPAPVTSGAT